MAGWLSREANGRIAGVIRVGAGLAALMELLASTGRMLALAEPDATRLPIIEPVATLIYAGAPAILLIWLLSGFAFTAGFATPVSGAILAAVMFALVTGDAQLYSNHAYLIAISVAMLTASGAGSSFSIDGRRKGTDALPAAAWTIRAIRVQVTIMYLFAAAAKMNPSFLSGSVLSASLRRDGIAFPEALISFESMFVLSLLVIASELFLAWALWRHRWRRWAFVLGLALHGGIVLTMYSAWDLATFSVVTLALYIAFLDAPRQGRTVVWDDSCGFCGTWVRWFRRLDWLDALRFVPLSRLPTSDLSVTRTEALDALHTVGPRGTHRAFGAVVEVLSVLPISFLWAPLLSLPPIKAIGERAYARVARSRTCAVGSGPSGVQPENRFA